MKKQINVKICDKGIEITSFLQSFGKYCAKCGCEYMVLCIFWCIDLRWWK